MREPRGDGDGFFFLSFSFILRNFILFRSLLYSFENNVCPVVERLFLSRDNRIIFPSFLTHQGGFKGVLHSHREEEAGS